MDVHNLNQGGSLTLLPVSDTQEESNSQGTGEEGPGSEEVDPLDLSDYLIAKMESDSDNQSNPEMASPISDESYMDCTTTSSASSDSVLF